MSWVRAKVNLEAVLKEKDASLSGLQVNLDGLNAEKLNLTTSLGNRNAEFDALNAKLGDLRVQLDGVLAEKATLQKTVAGQDTQINDLRAEVQRVKSEGEKSLGEKIAEVGALTVAGTATIATIKQKDDALAGAQTRVAELEAQLAELHGARAAFETSIGEHNVQVEGLTAQLTGLSGERDAAQVRIVELEAQLNSAKASFEANIGEHNVQIEGLTAQLNALTGERDTAQKRLGIFEANSPKLDDLNAQLKVVLNEKAEQEAQNSKLRADLSRAQEAGEKSLAVKIAEIGALTAAGATTLKLIQQKDEALAASQHRAAELEAQLASLNGARASFEASIDERTLQVEALNAKLSALITERDTAQQRITELDATVNTRAGDLDSLNLQIGSLKDDLTGMAADRDTALANVRALELNVNERIAKVDELSVAQRALQEQFAAARSERDAALAQVKSLEAEASTADALNAQIGTLQNRVLALTSEREERMSVIRALESDLANARAQLAASVEPPTASTASTVVVEAAPAPAATLVVNKKTGEGDGARKTRTLVSGNVTKAAATKAAKATGAKTKVVACPQHLQEVKNIGTVFKQRLYAAGIGTYWELVHLSDDEIVRILELSERQKARMDFDAVRKDATRLAKETDSVGRIWEGTEPDNFEPLEGIGPVYEKRLYEAGICTFTALADASIEDLMRICPPTKIRKPDYEDWIAQARKLARKAKG